MWLFLFSGFILGFAGFGLGGVLRNLYILRLGYGPEFIGLATAVGSLSWAALALPAGMLGRRWGGRRAMVLGQTLAGVSAVLLACADFVPQPWRSAWVLTTMSLGWISAPLYIVNGLPFLAGATDEEERDHAFSVFLALIPLGGFAGALVAGRLPGLFGALLGSSLDAPSPFRYSLWLGGIVYLAGVLALLGTRPVAIESSPATRRRAGPAPYALLAVLGVVTLLFKAASAGPQTFFNVYLDAGLGVTTARIGMLVAAAQLVAAVTVLGAPLLMARYGRRRTFVLACLGMAAGLLPLALVPHWVAAGIGFVVVYMMAFTVDAAFNTFSQESVTPSWRSTVSGVAFTAEGLSRMLIGLGGGRVIAGLGYGPFFLIVAALPATAALLFWANFRGPRGEAADAPVPDAAAEPG